MVMGSQCQTPGLPSGSREVPKPPLSRRKTRKPMSEPVSISTASTPLAWPVWSCGTRSLMSEPSVCICTLNAAIATRKNVM